MNCINQMNWGDVSYCLRHGEGYVFFLINWFRNTKSITTPDISWRTATCCQLFSRYLWLARAIGLSCCYWTHGDVIKWKHFPRYWPFVRGIQRSPVNSPHKGEWRGALMFCLIGVWINGWVNNGEAGGLRCHRAHYDVIVMTFSIQSWKICC